MKVHQKICLVSNTAWSFTRFRLDVLKALIDRGYDVLLLAPEDDHVEELCAIGVRFMVLTRLSGKGMNPLQDFLLYREFKQIYRRERPAIVIHYTIKPNIYGTLAAHALRIPVISVITGLGYTFIAGGLISKVAMHLYKFALKRASRVWFLNQDDLTFFIQHKLVAAGDAKCIPGEGVNVDERFHPAFVKKRKDKTGFTFLFIGRLLYDKGIREFVAAAREITQRYPTVNFQIVGYLNVDNPTAISETELAAWVRDGVVAYLGAVTDVRSVIAEADCVVLPSYREGMSTTLQESAAMEKPLIASNIAGCKELIDDGITGFLCQVKDVPSLVACMERLLKLSPGECDEMGKRGRRKMIAEFSVDRVIQQYFDELKTFVPHT